MNSPAPKASTGPETVTAAASALDDMPLSGLLALIGIVTGVQTLATFSLLALSTVGPKVAETMGANPAWIGYQVSLAYVAAAVCSVVAGAAVRRFGAAQSSAVAMLVSGAAVIAFASGSIPAIVIGSLALGLAYGLTNPAASSLLFRFGPPSRRNLIFAVKQTGVPLGGMLASLSLPLLSERFGWQAALAGSSLVFAGLAVILWRRRPRWDDDREPGHRIRGGVLQSLRVIFSDPMLLALGVLGFFYSGFQMIIMTYTVTMLVTEVGWSLVAAGVVASAMQIGGAVGRIGWGVMADAFRNSTAVLILIGLLSLGLCWLVLGLDNRMPVMLVIGLFGGFGLTAVGWNGVYMAEVARLAPPGQVAAATGGSLVFCFAGAMSGPAGFALIHDWAGSYTSAFAFVMLTPLAGALAVGLASFRRRG